MTKKFKAGDQFPITRLNSFSGKQLNVGEPGGGHDWKMVVVYRGRHCPLCTSYLQQLDGFKQEFYNIGIDLIAISGDTLEQAQEHQNRMKLGIPLAYGLTVKQMQQLGLYISHPRSEKETDHPFAEPGLFVINETGKVQIIDISNGPFVRPELKTLISGLKFIRDSANNYPIRGTYE